MHSSGKLSHSGWVCSDVIELATFTVDIMLDHGSTVSSLAFAGERISKLTLHPCGHGDTLRGGADPYPNEEVNG